MTSDGKIYRDVSHASMSPQERAALDAALDAAIREYKKGYAEEWAHLERERDERE